MSAKVTFNVRHDCDKKCNTNIHTHTWKEWFCWTS